MEYLVFDASFLHTSDGSIYRLFIHTSVDLVLFGQTVRTWSMWSRPKENATQDSTENAAENCSIARSYTDVTPDEDTEGNESQTNNDFDVFHRDASFDMLSS